MSASWGCKRIAGILINMIFPTFARLIIDSVAKKHTQTYTLAQHGGFAGVTTLLEV